MLCPSQKTEMYWLVGGCRRERLDPDLLMTSNIWSGHLISRCEVIRKRDRGRGFTEITVYEM